MTDRLDDLLYRLPDEVLPENLIPRVQARLYAQRQWERWQRMGGHLLLALSAGEGAWLLRPLIGSLGGWAPNLSVTGLVQWATGLVASPSGTAVATASGAIALGESLSAALSLPVLLALILIGAPATLWMIELLKQPAGREGVMV
jgi:hypothetical protein